MITINKDAWYFIAERLMHHGIHCIFGMVGDGCGLLEASEKINGMETLCARDQRSGIAIAMGYAQANQFCAVYCTSSGPGLMNSLMGILEADSGCLPLIILSNGVSRQAKGMGAFQEMDAIALLKPLTKWSYRIESQERLLWAIDRGIHLARNGKPRPVYIEIPNDLVPVLDDLRFYLCPPAIERHLTVPSDAKIREIAAIINKHEKILVIVGGGCRFSNAGQAIVQFVSAVPSALFSTSSGRNIYPESGQFACGLVGLYTSYPAQLLFAEAELIIVLGSQLEETCLMGIKTFLQSKPVIQLDVDYDAIHKSIFPQYPIVGDIRLTLETMVQYLKVSPCQEWIKLIAHVKNIQKKTVMKDVNQYPGKYLYHIVSTLSKRKKIIVLENGLHDMWAYSYPLLQLREGDICLTPAEQTGLGLAFGQIVGAKYHHPEKTAVVIAGDGAFTLGRNALFSVAEKNMGIICIILNSGGFSWPSLMQSQDHVDVGCHFYYQDNLEAFSQVLNAQYYRPQNSQEIESSVQAAEALCLDKKIVLIEIMVNVFEVPPGVKEHFLAESYHD